MEVVGGCGLVKLVLGDIYVLGVCVMLEIRQIFKYNTVIC
jgi:hypothetical protein